MGWTFVVDGRWLPRDLAQNALKFYKTKELNVNERKERGKHFGNCSLLPYSPEHSGICDFLLLGMESRFICLVT